MSDSLRRPSATAAIVILTAVVIVLSTRFVSGCLGGSCQTDGDGTQTVPMVPYWIPFVGHVPEFILTPERLLRGARDAYAQGVFALKIFGTTHNLIYSPSLAQSLLSQKESVAAHHDVSWCIMKQVFGFPARLEKEYNVALHPILAAYQHLLKEPYLGDMLGVTVRNLEQSIPDLVTFTSSIVDQAPWERGVDVRVLQGTDGQQTVEVSLLPLIRDFVAHAVTPSFLGSSFSDNHPTWTADIVDLDRGFLLMAAGFPRWVPIRTLTKAYLAQARLLCTIRAFHVALEKHVCGEDAGPEWRDMSDVSPIIMARQAIYRHHGFTIEARAACELAFLWAMNANAPVLIFWLILRILSYSDHTLLSVIRAETEPYAKAFQPPREFPVPEPPQLKIALDGLVSDCPRLKSCYIECLRLDSAPWSFKQVRQDFALRESARDGPGMCEGFLLRQGSYAHVAHDLHNTDPSCFRKPDEWMPCRHVVVANDQGVEKAEFGTIRAYGGGRSMCKGRVFAEKECLVFAAGILALWEFEPVGQKGWHIPAPGKATAVAAPKGDVRVRIRRRLL
ncbi:putative P450 monooxygenase [Cryomyces antarcticus]